MLPLRTITFRATGVPQPQGSMRAFTPKGWTRPILTSANPNLNDWRHVVAGAAPGGVCFERSRALRLTLHFDLPRPKSLPKKTVDHVKKPDLDKLVRACKDALTKVLWADDSQVVDIKATKGYAVAGVGVTVRIDEVRP